MATVSADSVENRLETEMIKDNIRNALAALAGEMAALLIYAQEYPAEFTWRMNSVPSDLPELLAEIDEALNSFEEAWMGNKARLCFVLLKGRDMMRFFLKNHNPSFWGRSWCPGVPREIEIGPKHPK